MFVEYEFGDAGGGGFGWAVVAWSKKYDKMLVRAKCWGQNVRVKMLR